MSSVASGATVDVASPAEPRPFYLNTSAHLLRIGRERATTLSELLQALRTCSENSIFQHTFRTLQEHHFIREGFSNDFAHWTFTACNERGLAERLAGIDVREFAARASRQLSTVGLSTISTAATRGSRPEHLGGN